jgi:hypothetical protein
MAEQLYAIRSRTGRGFRRGGVEFLHDKWTLLQDPAPEQLSEPQLECLPVSGMDDPILRRFEVVVVGEIEIPEVAETSDDEDPQLATLRQAVVDRDAEIERLKALSSTPLEPVSVKVVVTPDDYSVEAPEHVTVVVEFEDAQTQPQGNPFEGIKGLSGELGEAMVNAGIGSVDALRAAPDEALLAINGIGPKTLEAIREQLKAEA